MSSIDFGHTRCKVAYLDAAGKPNIVSNARGEDSTPTVVHVQPGREPLVGLDAVEQGFLDPAGCVSNFKLGLGRTRNLLDNGQVLTATDAAAIVIGKLKADAERALDREVADVVATCPANFRDNAKQAYLEAFARNGIKVLRLLPEPTAAAIAYAMDRQGLNMTVLVYDFGGGTFDVSLVRVQGSQIDILATDGVAKLGGSDINDCIRALVLDEIEAQAGRRPSPGEDPLLFHDLASRVEAAKISLGKRPEVPVVVGYNGAQVVVKVAQEWLHQAIDPLVDQSLQALDSALSSAGLRPSDVTDLVMVGGTSRLPYIQRRVADHTGLSPKTSIDPVKAVAYGGAVACIAEMAKEGKTATIRGQVVPAPEVFYQDVTAHDVGCCVVDRSGPTRRLVNSVIIPKNTAIPCKKADFYCLEHEDQTAAQIEILQGKHDSTRDECLLIGEMVVGNLPKEEKRTARLHVEYVIDANGMVTATVTDKVSGQQETVSVDYKRGIKPKDKPNAA